MSRRPSAFEEKVAALVTRAGTVTLRQLGGIDAIPEEATRSPIFPFVVAAILDAFPPESGRMPDVAASLVLGAVETTASGLALADICAAVVPSANGAGLVPRLKDALRHRIQVRSTEAEAGIAATALQALCHLAVLDDAARPALLDTLTGVGGERVEEGVFAVAAAHVAGIAFDHWRDPAAVSCLERLIETDAEADAWFALGLVCLVEALDRPDVAEIMVGVREAIEPFGRAVERGEDRADARLYLAVVLFLSAWTAGAPSAELQRDLDAAGEAATSFWFHGLGMSERYGWYRPRLDAEFRWLDLLELLRTVASAEDPQAWYRPAQMLDALADALEAARTMQPAATAQMEGVTNLGAIVEPRLATPFLREVASLGWLEVWLAENRGPVADRLREAIVHRVGELADRGKAAAGDLSALAEVLGADSVSGAPDDILLRVNQRRLDWEALRRVRQAPVVNEALRTVVAGLRPCGDFVGEVRQRFEWLVEKVVLFLQSRMNVQKGGAGGRYAYLYDPEALESELAADLKSWLEGNYPGMVLAEVREIGGGRTDLIVVGGNFRLVIELKREQDNASREQLRGYLPQVAAYEATDVALGMLVVLDLTEKPTAPANIRDNVWVDVVDGPTPGDRPRFVVAVRVPGNRKSPSEL